MDDDRTALIAKALAHPARVHIVKLLSRQQECRGADLFADLPLAQSTISQHLQMLRQADVVNSHAIDQGSVYCLNPEVLASFCEELSSIVTATTPCSLDTEECR